MAFLYQLEIPIYFAYKLDARELLLDHLVLPFPQNQILWSKSSKQFNFGLNFTLLYHLF